MAEESQSYNLGALRELLTQAFSTDELRALVAYDDRLKPLVLEFASTDPIIAMADKSISWCERRGLIGYFVERVKEARPDKVKEFEDTLYRAGALSPTRDATAEAAEQVAPVPAKPGRRRVPTWVWPAAGAAIVLIILGVALPRLLEGWGVDQATSTPTEAAVVEATTPAPKLAEQIAFVSARDGNKEIYLMNADGSGQTNLTNNLATEWGPAWSPDGERISFVSDRDGNEEIYVMNADGSGQTNLTRTSGNDRLPVWSPNGSQIAFISDRDGRDEVYVMESDGLRQTRLMNNSGYLDIVLNSISWSPDSSRIVFFSDYGSGNWDIYAVSTDGSGRGTRLTDSLGRDECPAWSPDSERIAYVADTNGIADIYLINADGSGLTPLTSGPAIDLVPRWSPNGEQIAFVTDREGSQEIFVMNSDGSALRRLSYSVKDLDFAWSADGRQIVFLTEKDDDREIYVMNSDGTGQTRLTIEPGADYGATWRP